MPEWLNENRIHTAAQPYFTVDVFGMPVDVASGFPTKYSIDRIMITEAKLSGYGPGSRRGTFKFLDPDGNWPQKLMNAGAYVNSEHGRGFPNLVVHFGWRNLLPDGSTKEQVEKLSGLILKTRFSIDETTAMTTIEIDYIEAVVAWFSNLRFLSPRDMLLLNEFDKENGLETMSVSDLLTYIWENCSIKESIDNNPDLFISINFLNTGDDKKIDGRKFRIRYGDSLEQKINEISSQANHTVTGEDKEDDVAWSYERVFKWDDLTIGESNEENVTGFEYKAIANYGWRSAKLLNEDNDNSMDGIHFNSGEAEEIFRGPALLWKVQKEDSESKLMLSWDSDLNSKEYLIHLAQAELAQKLGQYSDSDWDAATAFFEYASEKNDSSVSGVGVSNDQIIEASKDLDVMKARTGLGRLWSRLGIGKQGALIDIVKDESRTEMIDLLTREIAGGASVDSQIAAIIANNVFKGSAVILGDPSFGTTLLPYEVKMAMEFGAVGAFASVFARDWILTEVTHNFSEGNYTTELKLMTYPVIDLDIRDATEYSYGTPVSEEESQQRAELGRAMAEVGRANDLAAIAAEAGVSVETFEDARTQIARNDRHNNASLISDDRVSNWLESGIGKSWIGRR